MSAPILQFSSVHGIIDRRLLLNYRVDPGVLARILPPPFQPKLIHGSGIAGICLIRLKHIKPPFISGEFGLSSENAAHRIAVQWIENGTLHEGVYIPRRDTSSHLSTVVGGRLFPGIHHHANFQVREQGAHMEVVLSSDDDQTRVAVTGHIDTRLPPGSVFHSLAEASSFFEAGALGYSATARPGEYDGLELHSLNWKVEPFTVERIESSFFEDMNLFPVGSLEFDCALVMRGIEHEWHARESLCCAVAA